MLIVIIIAITIIRLMITRSSGPGGGRWRAEADKPAGVVAVAEL